MNALLEWVGLEKIQWIVQDFYTSRFAESLERCQMESQKISPPDPLVLPIARRAWLQSSFSLGCSLLISLAGCPGKAPDRTKNDAAGKVGRGDLPPLKIGILDCDELSEVLVNRWQEYSDQPIELIRFERLKVGTQDSPSLDVILYPGNFLGTLFEKEWIAPLPSLLLERLGGQKQNGDKRNTGKKSLTPKNLDSEDSPQGFESWSSRWRSIAHYNGKSVGLPGCSAASCLWTASLGVMFTPCQVIVTVPTSPTPTKVFGVSTASKSLAPPIGFQPHWMTSMPSPGKPSCKGPVPDTVSVWRPFVPD